MSFLLDTNILSELRKPASRRDTELAAWWVGVRAEEVYLSVLAVGEIRKGIERVRGADPAQAGALDAWLAQIEMAYSDRILPVTQAIAVRWGRAQALRSYPAVDALMAATADEHGLQLVTRNGRDLSGWPAVRPVLDPFSA